MRPQETKEGNITTYLSADGNKTEEGKLDQ